MRKHWLYLQYVLRHKWFVLIECRRRGLWWRGLMHDMSKFRPSEWVAYVNYFYGASSDHNYRVNEAFNLAWLHHQHRNLHHWQYWVLKEDEGGHKVLPMPHAYRTEMLCDWFGAGRAQGHPDTRGWYLENRGSMNLHPDTRAWVETELRVPSMRGR